MPFPDAPRVLYAISPLDEVICQLRFPPILRIDAEAPVGFQEAVRAQYPFYEAKPVVRMPAGVPSDLAQMLSGDLPLIGAKSHEFASRDRSWTLKLNRQFLAQNCRSYDRWDSFRGRLTEACGALAKEYNPTFFTRIGLRYRNIIRRSRLPAKEPLWSWNELIQPWIAGLLSRPEMCDIVDIMGTTSQFSLADGVSRCTLNFGLAMDESTQEVVFLIDADYFTEQQTDPSDAFKCLDTLNREARLLFRWCITERLHGALEPRPAD